VPLAGVPRWLVLQAQSASRTVAPLKEHASCAVYDVKDRAGYRKRSEQHGRQRGPSPKSFQEAEHFRQDTRTRVTQFVPAPRPGGGTKQEGHREDSRDKEPREYSSTLVRRDPSNNKRKPLGGVKRSCNMS